MKRIKALDCWQKGFLLLFAAMILVFSWVYYATIAREGILYRNTILVPSQENGNMLYSGEIKGERACFTVYADKTVEFQHGDKTYGPYTVREDASAVTKAIEAELGVGEPVAGIEFCKEGEILFRGGVVKHRDYIWLYNEDGSADTGWINDLWAPSDDVIVKDGNGNIIDQMEPGILTILNLMAGPELVHKGDWSMWFCGVLVCVFTMVSILFVDELFRWHLSFHISNAEQAEPSEWEIMSRYLGWGLMVIVAAMAFIEGLR